MKIKACLFDLDGVIVDTAKYHYLAWKELANGLDFDFTEHDNERLKGVSRMESLNILLEIGNVKASKDEKEKMADEKNKRYVGYITQMEPNEILPGVVAFLTSLKKAGIKTAIGSASKNAPSIIDKLKIGHLFDVIIDGNVVQNAKPDPEVFLKGALALNVAPSECIVFEDAASGVEAAINGRMKCIGVGDPSVLHKANMVISGFEGFTIDQLMEFQ
jgi:beta-phosphoglucomutase